MSAESELRDRFALAALPGLLANPDLDADYAEFARIAYRYADAMLIARQPARSQAARVKAMRATRERTTP